jgi:SAM-dependent methyltransferase
MVQQEEATIASNPAETYESYFVPATFRPWSEELLRRTHPRPGERVLDVACGTGIVARQVAPLVGATGTIAGIDINPAMLDVARSLPPPPGAAISWQEAAADRIPFADGVFDLVLCQQGFQFFPVRLAAASEMRRVLRPGGRIGVSVWRGIEHQSLLQAFDQAIERHLGEPEVGGPFAFGDGGELRRVLQTAGFTDMSVEAVTRTVRFPRPEQFVRLTILASAAVMPMYEQMDEAAREALVAAVIREVAETVEVHRDGDELAFTMASHIAVAQG